MRRRPERLQIAPGMRDSGLVCWYGIDMNELLSRISIDPNVCFGKPCIRGTRIWVSLLLDFLASGATIDEILQDYQQLKRDDILAAIAYGAEMSRERFVDLPISAG
jgi:uncharacterized protein (DUF433 family)